MEGLLCKECFDKKEESHEKKKNFCAICGGKDGTNQIQSKEQMEGRRSVMQSTCWDEKKAEFG